MFDLTFETISSFSLTFLPIKVTLELQNLDAFDPKSKCLKNEKEMVWAIQEITKMYFVVIFVYLCNFDYIARCYVVKIVELLVSHNRTTTLLIVRNFTWILST